MVGVVRTNGVSNNGNAQPPKDGQRQQEESILHARYTPCSCNIGQ
jgi:hypothetical protein